MPGRRVIIHAGFHKTGTSSAQNTLYRNGKLIWPRSALIMTGKLRAGAALMAARYARFGTPTLLDEFANDLHKTLSAVNPGQHRKILISDENLAGRMPGRDGQASYNAAPALMARTEAVARDVFGADADVVFVFTTRASEPWLWSTYKHNLRASRLTLDWAAYRAAYGVAADLSAVADKIRDRVGGRLETHQLETLTGPFGPAAPLLDLLELPGDVCTKLEPQPAMNQGPGDDMVPQLLALNRASLSDDDLSQAKAHALKGPQS